MPRGKFIGYENPVKNMAAREEETRKSASRITLIKSEAVAEEHTDPKRGMRLPDVRLVESSEYHHLSFVFTFLLVALFVLINIGLAVIMKGDNDKPKQETAILATPKTSTETVPEKPVPAGTTPLTIHAPPENPRSQTPAVARPEPDLLSIISKE